MLPALLIIFLPLLLLVINGWIGTVLCNNRGNNIGGYFLDYASFKWGNDTGGNYAGNVLLKVIHPAIYTAILCAIAQYSDKVYLCNYFWTITPVYWLYRMLYCLAKGQIKMLNFRFEVMTFIISLILSEAVLWGICIPLIKQGKSVFIPIEELRNAVWYSIIVAVATVLWKLIKRPLDSDKIIDEDKKKNLVIERFNKLKKHYDNDVSEAINAYCQFDNIDAENFRLFVYAIMVYEDYNRSAFFRKIEYSVKHLHPKKLMTLGVMQTMTEKSITDRESIIYAVKKLAPTYLENIEQDPIRSAAGEYNQKEPYPDEIVFIYNAILEECEIPLYTFT